MKQKLENEITQNVPFKIIHFTLSLKKLNLLGICIHKATWGQFLVVSVKYYHLCLGICTHPKHKYIQFYIN